MSAERPPIDQLLTTFKAGELTELVQPELTPFEDALVRGELPYYEELTDGSFRNKNKIEEYEANWRMRPRLNDALKGETFHGQLVTLLIEKMSQDEAIDTFMNDKNISPSSNKLAVDTEQIVGLTFMADMHTSANKKLGPMEKRIWYVRVSPIKAQKSSDPRFWRRHMSKQNRIHE